MTHSPDNPPVVAGKTVVLAGLLDHIGRMEARLGLKKAGAEVVKELDSSVDFVVAKAGPKLEQALAMGIPQIDEPTLAAVLGISPFPPEPEPEPEPAPEPEPRTELSAEPTPELSRDPAIVVPTPEADAGPALPDLTGTTVMIAGTFDDLGRMEARLGLQKLGATVVKELDASLDYVVAGVKGGPKLQQALDLGVAQLDEPTLLALLARLEEKKAAAAVTVDEGPKLPKVDGAVIIIAGTLKVMGRPVAKRKLEKLGAIVTDKLDGGVSFVVAGPKGGPTLFNAKELGIEQIDEPTLQALVAQLPEEEDDAVEEGPPELAGALVAVAGVPTGLGRTQTARRLEKLGATVAERVDRHVKYVFVCQGGKSTLFQAKELGIREVDEATLLELIAHVPDDEDTGAGGPGVEDIAGKKLLIAGTLQQVGRVEAKRKLTRLGAEVVNRLTDDVAYVVAGADGGRNLFLAKKAELPIIEEPHLLTLLAQAPEDTAEDAPQVPAADELGGVRLVITGKLANVDRAQAKRKLTRVGALIMDKVDAEVAFVFAGEKGGRNVLLARQLSLPVFTESDLVDLLEQIPDQGPESAAAMELPDLAGRSVLLTGKLQQIDRRDAVRRLKQLGVTLMDRVDDSPDFVITGEKGGRAVFVAKQESIPVLQESTLLAILHKGVQDGVLPPVGDDDTGASQGPPPLTGASVAFTGKFPNLDLAALKQQLTERGVTVHPGITAETQFVVVGDSPSPMKLFRAKKLGLRQISVADTQAFLAT